VNLEEIKLEYLQDELKQDDLHSDPLEQFKKWMEQILKAEVSYPNAAFLSSCDEQGMPDSRTVLIKSFGDAGFRFYTNYLSKKGRDFTHNNKASLLFYWKEFDRQVRINGFVHKCSRLESEEYFNSRSRESKASAIISPQSHKISREDLIEQYQTLLEGDKELVCPTHWGGFDLTPTQFEFWQGRPNRFHDRFQYTQSKNSWLITRLGP
tara:strand:- start:10795 stop:11421 length:627 start_codon:yes stop_codon:yes gene_type:complete